MKRKLYVLAALCLLTGVAVLAEVNPGNPCTFSENGVIYLCTGHDCLCSKAVIDCTGIKLALMEEHPGELEP